LHHQNGVIGTFNVYLLEASDLKRTYWSALAFVPVKHLGLSKAHGDVLSYCTFSLGYHQLPGRFNYGVGAIGSSSSIHHASGSSDDKKPAAKPSSNKEQQQHMHNHHESKESPVV
jgi:hypothetical protein